MRFWSPPALSAIFLYSLMFLMLPLMLHASSKNIIILTDWIIFSSYASPMSLSLIFDPKGLLFSCIVMFISANVMVFTHSYMKEDLFMPRFTHLVLLFVASMNLLIFLPNLMTLLLGWDGLGLVSFLLVIYYQNPKSLAAGMVTALTNRIGDVLILLSIGWLLQQSQWNLMFFTLDSYSTLISISLMVAAMTKSAQIPFSSWLPAAMAAPTPVSALVHSSTLVTAGVFILIRFYPFLSSTKYFHQILLILATCTTLMAGLSANTECDMKKVIALSTLSQLGVMMISLGMGLPMFAFFHLLTHALFKALLFLCAGTLIHLHLHSQDLRFMGNLTHSMPSISAALIISNLALCGAPFLAGFYSKDLILEHSLTSWTNLVVIILFFFATGLTVSYTARFLVAVMWGPSNISPSHPVTDQDIYCSFPTFMLSLGAIMGGASMNWFMLSPFTEPILPLFLKTLTLTVSFFGLATGLMLASFSTSEPSKLMQHHKQNHASCTMWFLAPLSTQKLMPAPLSLGAMFSKYLDQGWEELMGGQGAMKAITTTSSYLMTPQSHLMTSYLSIAFVSIPLLLIIMI
uniref:NADH-ubiquinone oxidoreductase chain 5 n=1 Tax=Prionospio sp. 3 MH-2023 TaxID=3059271 RepID=A0AAU6QGM2_9ANNE